MEVSLPAFLSQKSSQVFSFLVASSLAHLSSLMMAYVSSLLSSLMPNSPLPFSHQVSPMMNSPQVLVTIDC